MVEYRLVPIDLIDPPEAAIRQHIPEDLIEELAQSIQAVGLIEPLVLEEVGARYRVIAGHRRSLACKRAGLVQVPCMVRPPGGASVQSVQLHENLIRQDMNPAEEARLAMKWYTHFNQDLERTAGHLKMTVGWVDSRLALGCGDPEVMAAVDREDIGLGVAQALNSIRREDYRRAALDLAVRAGATVTVVRKWAADYNNLGAIQTGEVTPQVGTESPTPDQAPTLSNVCWFCENGDNPHLFRLVPLHDHCIAALNALLKRIGSN